MIHHRRYFELQKGYCARLCLLLLLPTLAICAEQRVGRTSLPPRVRDTADREARGATVKGYTREIEHGKTYFEVETVKDGKTRDLLIDAAGKVTEVEEQIEITATPEPVQKALQSAAGSGQVMKVESVTKGRAVTYEASIRTAGRKREVAVDSTGKVVR